MSAIASQITSVSIVYSAVCLGAKKKTSQPRVTGLCGGNSQVAGKFPAQRVSKAENDVIMNLMKCGAVTTQTISSKSSQLTPRRSPAMARYWVPFENLNSY